MGQWELLERANLLQQSPTCCLCCCCRVGVAAVAAAAAVPISDTPCLLPAPQAAIVCLKAFILSTMKPHNLAAVCRPHQVVNQPPPPSPLQAPRSAPTLPSM